MCSGWIAAKMGFEKKEVYFYSQVKQGSENQLWWIVFSKRRLKVRLAIKCSKFLSNSVEALSVFEGKWCKRAFPLLIFIVVVVELIGVAIP